MSAMELALLAAITEPPTESDGEITAAFCLPEDFPGFRGHFPGSPICPAVVQARAALLTLERARGLRYRLEGMANAKFINPLGPEQPFTVKLTPRKNAMSFDANLVSDGKPIARMRLTVSPIGDGDE